MAYILKNEDVDRLLDPRTITELVRAVLVDDGAVEAPRTSLEHRGSWFGVMPAAGMGFYSVKLVGVYPDNPGRGLPLVRGRLLLFDSATGDLLLEAEAEAPTGWRTAAATALALEVLGGTGGVLGVIGSGVQARYHLMLLTSLYGYDGVLVYSRRREKAGRLASMYGGSVAGLEDLLSRSDTIVATTNSTQPVVHGSLLRDNVVVASVGAPRPVRELDPETIARASCILVDTPMVLEESGDVTPSVLRGRSVVELRDALVGAEKCPGRGIRVYKSVGRPLLDLAAALALYRKLDHIP